MKPRIPPILLAIAILITVAVPAPTQATHTAVEEADRLAWKTVDQGWSTTWSTFDDGWNLAWDGVIDPADDLAWSSFDHAWKATWALLSGAWGDAWGHIGNAHDEAWDYGANVHDNAWNTIGHLHRLGWSAAGGAYNYSWNQAGPAWNTAWSPLASPATLLCGEAQAQPMLALQPGDDLYVDAVATLGTLHEPYTVMVRNVTPFERYRITHEPLHASSSHLVQTQRAFGDTLDDGTGAGTVLFKHLPLHPGAWRVHDDGGVVARFHIAGVSPSNPTAVVPDPTKCQPLDIELPPGTQSNTDPGVSPAAPAAQGSSGDAAAPDPGTLQTKSSERWQSDCRYGYHHKLARDRSHHPPVNLTGPDRGHIAERHHKYTLQVWWVDGSSAPCTAYLVEEVPEAVIITMQVIGPTEVDTSRTISKQWWWLSIGASGMQDAETGRSVALHEPALYVQTTPNLWTDQPPASGVDHRYGMCELREDWWRDLALTTTLLGFVVSSAVLALALDVASDAAWNQFEDMNCTKNFTYLDENPHASGPWSELPCGACVRWDLGTVIEPNAFSAPVPVDAWQKGEGTVSVTLNWEDGATILDDQYKNPGQPWTYQRVDLPPLRVEVPVTVS